MNENVQQKREILKENLFEIIKDFSKEKGLDHEVVIKLVEESLIQAAQRKLPYNEIEGQIDEKTGKINLSHFKEVVEIVKNYAKFMNETQIPKLFINADPGSILIGKQREIARQWPNQKEVTVKGGHFIQEVSPDEIGKFVREFLIGLKE